MTFWRKKRLMHNYPSVTQVLSPWGAYNSIPPETLKNAQERGIRVHGACFSTILGLWFPPLPNEWQGYLDSFINWFNQYVSKIILVEPELVCHTKKLKGHPDLILQMKGDECLSIPDLKTPLAHSRAWAPQCAGYRYLASVSDYQVERNFSLRLRPDGKPALMNEYSGNYHFDLSILYNALACWRYFNR